MREGRVRLRSNVVLDAEAWHLVPGDALRKYRPDLLKLPNRPTPRQRDEHGYYLPCSICGRLSHQIRLEGCGDCRHAPRAEEIAEAKEARGRAMESIARLRNGAGSDV